MGRLGSGEEDRNHAFYGAQRLYAALPPRRTLLDSSASLRVVRRLMNRVGPRSGALLILAGLVIAAPGCGPARWLPRWADMPISTTSREAPPTEEAQPRKIKHILALSGGGSYGAFTAGVLNGWSRTNTRPEFDVVTGVSTGALIAPMAFLGSDYDPQIKHFYTEVQRKDVFAYRSWVTVPFRDALASTAPLRQLVESGLTDQVMAGLVREHAKGRRLYVATTNLQTRKPTVWDLGALATERGKAAKQIIVDVLVASAAVPGIFPPVTITLETDRKTVTETHVDGGVSTPVFVPPAVLQQAPGATLTVIISHKLYPDAAEVRPRVLKVLGASGTAMIHAHTRCEVAKLATQAELLGLTFQSVSLRQDFEVTDSAIEFDQTNMNKMFVEGVRVGLAGPIWDADPAKTDADDLNTIRSSRWLHPPGVKPAKPE